MQHVFNRNLRMVLQLFLFLLSVSIKACNEFLLILNLFGHNIERHVYVLIIGITASSDYGGTGGKYSDHCVIMEELSRYVFLCKYIGIL